MSASGRIVVFLAGLLAIFAAAVAVGSLVEPAETEDNGAHGRAHAVRNQDNRTERTMEAHTAQREMDAPAGLGISEGGYVLRISPAQLVRREARELRFSINDAGGLPVTNFDELHERRVHLIVVRRDGAQFRHLHPEMDDAGTWSVPVKFTEPGVYRAFADFSVDGEQHTLANHLFVSGGEFEAQPFPPPSPVYETNGYEVRLQADDPLAGEPTSLTFSVSRSGQAVHDLAPYLGAKGHLVALREGDLAFLHVHPEEAEGEHGHGDVAGHGEGAGAEEIAFAANFPTPGHYRLYLQFKDQGVVQTAQFTVVVLR